mgnify:CR=1 FL=1
MRRGALLGAAIQSKGFFMRITCPSCGAVTSLEAAANDKSARQVAVFFGKLPPRVASALPSYLAMFRPSKQGLRWGRVEKILSELAPMILEGFVENRRRCRPSAEIWAAAIQQVAERSLNRPLANHNYLKKVAADLFERADARWEAERDTEQRKGQAAPARPTAPELSPLDSRLLVIDEHLAAGMIDEAEADTQRAEARERFGQ